MKSHIFALSTLFAAAISAATQVGPVSITETLNHIPESAIVPRAARQCDKRSLLKRKSWHALTRSEKKAYLDAEKCLLRRPSKLKDGAVNRFEDLIKVHQQLAPFIHGTGWFLPFHRLYLHAHETLLRDECGYKGAQPYWDETIDAGAFSRSILLDPVHGFGGNGTGPQGCVTDGPFANLIVHVGPAYDNIPTCLIRNVHDGASAGSAKTKIDKYLQLDKFEEFWHAIEGETAVGLFFLGWEGPVPEGFNPPLPDGFGNGPPPDFALLAGASPHGAGHAGVGGGMLNGVSSPGDPLFYMHHAFIDRIWWLWQEQKESRLGAIAGNTSLFPNMDWTYTPATLDDTLKMYGIVPDAKVRDVMDVRGKRLCNVYV